MGWQRAQADRQGLGSWEVLREPVSSYRFRDCICRKFNYFYWACAFYDYQTFYSPFQTMLTCAKRKTWRWFLHTWARVLGGEHHLPMAGHDGAKVWEGKER